MFSFGKKAPAPLSIDEELDRIGAGRFHVFTLVACSLTSASQSIILNLLPLLQPCAGYALERTAPADAASTSTAAFVVACNDGATATEQADAPTRGVFAGHGRR